MFSGHLLDLHEELPGGFRDPFVDLDLDLAELGVPVACIA
jgi:hypothetical protein